MPLSRDELAISLAHKIEGSLDPNSELGPYQAAYVAADFVIPSFKQKDQRIADLEKQLTEKDERIYYLDERVIEYCTFESLAKHRLESLEEAHEYTDIVENQLAEQAETIKRLQDEREWRPIETAPKDATDQQVYCSDSNQQFIAFYDVNHGGWIFACSNGGVKFICKPTHWKPKPPPPTGEE